MPQYARPTADTTIDTWTTQAAASSNLYLTLDETATDTSDYVRTRDWPYFEPYEAELSLTGITDTGTDTNVQVHYQLNSGSSELATFHMWARQGSTYIDRWVERDVDNTSADLSHTFSDAACALINYAQPLIVGWEATLQPTSLLARPVPPIALPSQWYIDFRLGMQATEVTNFVWTANRAYFTPILVPKTQNFDAIAVHVGTGVASSTAYIAIYEMRYDGQLGARIFRSSQLDTSTATLKVATFGSNIQFTAGWYWIAGVCTGAITTWGFNAPTEWAGVSSSAWGYVTALSVDAQTDLTDPGPTLTASGVSTIPKIGLRAT